MNHQLVFYEASTDFKVSTSFALIVKLVTCRINVEETYFETKCTRNTSLQQ